MGIDLKLAKILINLDEQVGEDIIYLKKAVEKTGVTYLTLEEHQIIEEEFKRLHPEYKKYHLLEADTPISWQSKICYTVYSKTEIQEPSYVLAESMFAKKESDSGQRLRYFRKQKGMSQAKLAEICGIHTRTLQNYESNLKSICTASAKTVKSIADALEISMEELMD